MKRLEEYIREDHSFLVKSNAKKSAVSYKYFPKDRDELIDIIEKRIKKEGNNCDLNDIDVSEITDLTGVFGYFSIFDGNALRGSFNGDISNWDVSNVKDMCSMFRNSVFNGDISNWNVSNVQDMGHMFEDSKFNGDISNWDVSITTRMDSMFNRCPLENNPPKWYKK